MQEPIVKIALAIVLLIGSELSIRALDRSFAPAPALPLERPLSDLPQSIGPWTGESVELDPRLNDRSGAGSMIERAYYDGSGRRVSVSLGAWLDYLPQIPHRPEVCYPAAGWEIVERKLIEIPLGKGSSWSARLVTFEKNAEKIAVMYWVRLGPTIALDDGDMRQALQQSLGQSRPAAVKIMLQADAQDPATAERLLIDFAAQLQPQLDELLDQDLQ